MSITDPTIESVESYIRELEDLIGTGVSNIVPNELVDKVTFNEKLGEIEYQYYLMFGDRHYFVSRVLFMNFVFDYSYFSGHQCIENYLKGFIKSKNEVPSHKHTLSDLLKKCRDVASEKDEFIWSEEIATIIYRYNPFYTLPRYPVSQTKWEGISSTHPDDIYLLDYFVLRFRKMLPLPENMSDILKGDDIHAFLCKRHSPNFYNSFLDRNINFSSV